METEKLDGKTVKLVTEVLEEEFKTLINSKTGWGKNEIMIMFERAKSNALMRLLQ